MSWSRTEQSVLRAIGRIGQTRVATREMRREGSGRLSPNIEIYLVVNPI